MKYLKPLVLAAITLSLVINLSCEKDDICAETTATTPHLIIKFFDVNIPTNTKAVSGLSVIGEGLTEGNEIVYNTTKDSIVLPLRFQDENIITTTRFELKKNTSFDTDTNTETASNTDIIEVSYTPKFVYVSRACGYKSIFENAQITIEPDTDNWIFSYDIINSTIENEKAAHINIYH